MTTMQLAKPRARAHRAGKGEQAALNLRAMDEEQLAELAEQLKGSAVPGVRMTEREFVDWAFNHVDAEWADGEVILMAPVSNAHDSVDMWLGTLLYQFVEARALGVVKRDMFVRFTRRRRRRVPDIMFIAEGHRNRILPTYIDGAPDLIVEIVSPDSQNRDRRDKYLDYEAGGVREYWIIDPMSQTLDAYTLRGRKYDELPVKSGRIDSVVLPGVFLRSKWLFGRQRPKVAQVLKEFGIKD